MRVFLIYFDLFATRKALNRLGAYPCHFTEAMEADTVSWNGVVCAKLTLTAGTPQQSRTGTPGNHPTSTYHKGARESPNLYLSQMCNGFNQPLPIVTLPGTWQFTLY